MRHIPSTLRAAGAKFWREFLQEFEPETSTEFALLETVCSLADNISDCNEAIQRDGDYVMAGSKFLSHPALRHLAQFNSLYMKGLDKLRQKEKSGPKETSLKGAKKGGKHI